MTTNEPDFLHYLKGLDLDFETEGKYNMPKIKGMKFKHLDKASLLGFNYATQPENMDTKENSFIHFFLPDHYIERVWDNLEYYEAIFRQYKGICQPDFSQYTNMPRAMQIWNNYRCMWVSAYYQSLGIHVLPCPRWSDEESYEYCFDGMPHNSCLCISNVGCVQNPHVRELFNLGFQETLNKLTPSQLIIYGKLTDWMKARITCPYIVLESEQQKRIDNWKAKNNL